MYNCVVCVNAVGSEPVRTLFVRGLPLDVKYREVYNLFCLSTGYESCNLNWRGKTVCCVWLCVMCVRAREREEFGCVYVCVWERETER